MRFLAILLFTTLASAQPVLKSVDLQADLAILRQAYEQLHPGL